MRLTHQVRDTENELGDVVIAQFVNQHDAMLFAGSMAHKHMRNKSTFVVEEIPVD